MRDGRLWRVWFFLELLGLPFTLLPCVPFLPLLLDLNWMISVIYLPYSNICSGNPWPKSRQYQVSVCISWLDFWILQSLLGPLHRCTDVWLGLQFVYSSINYVQHRLGRIYGEYSDTLLRLLYKLVFTLSRISIILCMYWLWNISLQFDNTRIDIRTLHIVNIPVICILP